MHRDDRGVFTEVFRAEWEDVFPAIQWNVVRTKAGVLRGVHVHLRHWDYLIVLDGQAFIGLHDLRPASPTAGLSALVELRGDALSGLVIPPGVAHGFYFPVPSMHMYAVSEYWDLADELGCHWQDPALCIPWPMDSAILSSRDANLPSLEALKQQMSQVGFTEPAVP